jgi:hypothetical protein
LGSTDNLPCGYLFLCPEVEFEAEVPTSFRISDQLVYWSLDLSGVDRLSDKVAKELGFPAIRLQMQVYVMSWDASVYDGIYQFHKGKHFDPYSQEVALELGHPLFQLSCNREALLAHRTHIEINALIC